MKHYMVVVYKPGSFGRRTTRTVQAKSIEGAIAQTKEMGFTDVISVWERVMSTKVEKSLEKE